jgi:adenylate cyclase
MINTNKITAVTNWLAAGAPPSKGMSDFVAECGRRFVAAGLPVDSFGIYNTMIHPKAPGRYNYWTPAGGARRYSISTEQLKQDGIWIGSPAQTCLATGRVVTCTFGASPEYDDRADMQQLASRGYTQIIYTPLHKQFPAFPSVAAYGTKQEGGFTDSQLHTARLVQAPLARVIEIFNLHACMVQVLSTYVGRDAGRRVIEGNILRGDAETIPSIVLFTDLRNFTELSNTQSANDVIHILNRFYDIAEAAITRNGGEILKFIGDGLLVIFPTPDDLSAQMAAASGAITALEETRSALAGDADIDLSFRASLHLGDIHYGNIGSKSRLDFTAIGPAVNLAARLMSVADDHGADTVCSEVIHQLLPDRTQLLGEFTFKGFKTPHRVFRLNS